MTTVPFLSPVKENLEQVETVMLAQADDRHADLRAAFKHLLSAGGKRIRPALVLLSGNMLGGDTSRLVTLAAAVEMLHSATLVHDDLIDGALFRRGIPTLNAHWSPAATVLTGDFIFARAAKLAAETDSLPVMKHFAETLAIIVNGELTQLFKSKGVASRDNYYQRIYAKTASLFETCSYTAALICEVDDDVRESMRKFGYSLGMAFQIVDDILDFTGNQAAVGKPVGSDLLNGLITLPALYYIENNPHDADVQALKDGGYSKPERMERLVDAIRNSPAIDNAVTEASQHIDNALQALTDFPASTEKNALEDLAKYVIDRDL